MCMLFVAYLKEATNKKRLSLNRIEIVNSIEPYYSFYVFCINK